MRRVQALFRMRSSDTALPAWSSRDMPDVLELLDEPGCVLCRTQDGWVSTWVAWFRAENHSADPTLRTVQESLGFCPAHTRLLLGLGAPTILRAPWEFVLSAAISRVEAALKGSPDGRAAIAPCPICHVVAVRVQEASEDLLPALQMGRIAAALRDRGGLCYNHLRDLLAHLSPRQANVVAGAVRALLSSVQPNTPQACVALAGHDADAPSRARLLQAQLRSLETEPTGLPPNDRLVVDLAADSCPVCRAVGREQARFLVWLAMHRQENGPSGLDLQLCHRHLHDTWAVGDAGPKMTSQRLSLCHRLVTALASTAAAAAERGRQPRRFADSPSRSLPGGANPAGAYEDALAEIMGKSYCRCCRIAQVTEERQLALVGACIDDYRVTDALARGHGLCLRHGSLLGAGPVLRRLLTRLREAAWEQVESTRKQTWDARYEPRGAEQTVWRRVPMLLDGEVYLGGSEAEAWPAQEMPIRHRTPRDPRAAVQE